MRHLGLHIIISIFLISCSVDQENEQVDSIQGDYQKATNNWTPEISKITDPKYPIDLLFKSWAHKSTDNLPAFTIDKDAFKINYGDTTVIVPYILHQDTIEIFEYHDGQTSKGLIKKLTTDSLLIKWTTGDKNMYIAFKE